jgi:hypothetical protein
MAGDAGVADRVLGIAVAEIVLDEPQIVAAVGEGEAAGVTQHVRVDRRQRSTSRGLGEQMVYRLASHLGATLGDEQPGQLVMRVAR